ncbi:LysM peptidoglycan-binding domain-containing protein [Litorilinea aerophila]|nr:LysM peptidoglycan-binding domain-containing protein [Litorilinea aerophila]MCC9075459.1 LysM peptidoglycan-binding domain-containing protein [Litorilinea aerophila]
MNVRSRAPHLYAVTASTLALAAVLLIGLVGALARPAQAQDEAQPRSTQAGYTYTVQEGDSWASVAATTGVDEATLRAANPQAQRDNDWLLVGEELFVPLAAASTPTRTHVVRSGESWSTIASQYNIPVDLLMAANPNSVRPGLVLYRGEILVIPARGQVPTATPTPAPTATATPTATAMATAAATATATGTVTVTAPVTGPQVSATVTTTASSAGAETLPPCPARFADYPESLSELVNQAGDVKAAVSAFLAACGAAVDNGLVTGDWTGDDVPDLVVVFQNPQPEATFIQNDLLIFQSSADGYQLGYRARAAGEVRLLATEDINADGQADVVWVDTTCGASTCFDTVNVRSWDGSTWADWTEGTITMAYAEISLDDRSPEGQGQEIVLNGGIYGSIGAGPQRSRTEVWASYQGAPYVLAEKSYSPSECLYHTVLDANRAFLAGPGEGFRQAQALYTQAVEDESLIECWMRPNELDELRSFSLYRLAVLASYQGDAEAAAEYIEQLGATYPDSVYDQLGQAWLQAYQESADPQAACQVANEYATEHPESWQMLADYGYTNPSFQASDVCPILELAEPDAQEAPAEAGAAPTATPLSAQVLPDCPATLSDYATTLPDVLTAVGNDQASLENWLRLCNAMGDGRGAVVLADLTGDGRSDAIFYPVIISDVGFGPDGAQGAVLIYHATADGGYTLAAQPDIYGQPEPLAVDDLNADGRMDIAWTVVGCSTFCVREVQMWTWDQDAYVSLIQPGATIAEGTAYFEPVAEGDPGSGQQLVLAGGVSGTPEGGLDVPHTEIWQSVDGGLYQRIRWTYDRDNPGSRCMGLRLVEADVALQAADVLGYGPAVEAYTDALKPGWDACSIFGLPAEEELILLQGLASFRLVQALALNGDLEAAAATAAALAQGQPDSDYSQATQQWLQVYQETGDPAQACEAVQPIFEANSDLWQITDHYGYNHPALAPEQICFVP